MKVHPYLDIQQIQLDWISFVDILVRIEILSSEDESFRIFYTLLSEGACVVKPIH